jgi:hypothetical protein
MLAFAMMAALAVAQNATPGTTDVHSINYKSAKVQPPGADVTTSVFDTIVGGCRSQGFSPRVENEPNSMQTMTWSAVTSRANQYR